jgi:hydrogenase maturation factor
MVMGVAYSVQVLAVQAGEMALVEVDGRLQEVVLSALADPVIIAGDWLLVEQGVALTRIDGDPAAVRDRGFDPR